MRRRGGHFKQKWRSDASLLVFCALGAGTRFGGGIGVDQAGGDDMDLVLSNMDAGLRLLSFLHDRMDPGDREAVARGESFLIEKLIAESSAARDLYDRCRQASLEAAQTSA